MSILDDLGIAKCTINYGKESSFTGNPVLGASVSVVARAVGVSNTMTLVWDASGDVFSGYEDTFSSDTTGSGLIELPQTGQDGFVQYTSTGKVAVRDWYYSLKRTSRLGQQSLTRVYNFQIPAGVTSIDLDRLPEDAAVTIGPTSTAVPLVESVNGRTGAVTLLTPLPVNRDGKGIYDPRANYYQPTEGQPLRRWQRALASARAGRGQAKLCIVGDSIVWGQYASPAAYSDGWVARLRDLFDRDLGASGGTGVVWAWNNFVGTTWRLDDTRVSWGGGDQNGYGPFTVAANRLSGGLVDTFTPDRPVDAFRVYYIKQTTAIGGTFTTQVDAQAPVTRTSGGATENVVGILDINAGILGTHTLTIANPSNNLYVVGMEGLVTGKGVAVTGAGAPGYQTGNYNAASADGQASWQFITAGVAPDLTVFGFGHNEYLNNVALTIQHDALTTAIQRAQAAGSDVLLMTTVPALDQTKLPPQTEVDKLRYTLADELGVPVLDLANRWVSAAASAGLYYDNVIHPNNNGYADIAAALYQAIR